MKYTEDDLRKAFQAGGYYSDDIMTNGNYSTELDEDEYINSLNKVVVKEREVPFTYFSLRQTLGWEQFCNLTGIDYYAKANGYQIEDNETFYITESEAKKFNLI